MKRKKKDLGSAKQRGPSKLTINNYHNAHCRVNMGTSDPSVIACHGFSDLSPLRIKVHRSTKMRSRRRRREPDPEQLVWIEADEWLTKLNDKGAA